VTAIKRTATDIFQIQIDYIGGGCVQEAVEKLFQGKLEFADESYDFVERDPVQRPSWST
jgi:hypothetical protein